MKSFPNRFPLPFLFLTILALLVALWAGLMRLGWQLPALIPSLGRGRLMMPRMISSVNSTVLLDIPLDILPPVLSLRQKP